MGLVEVGIACGLGIVTAMDRERAKATATGSPWATRQRARGQLGVEYRSGRLVRGRASARGPASWRIGGCDDRRQDCMRLHLRRRAPIEAGGRPNVGRTRSKCHPVRSIKAHYLDADILTMSPETATSGQPAPLPVGQYRDAAGRVAYWDGSKWTLQTVESVESPVPPARPAVAPLAVEAVTYGVGESDIPAAGNPPAETESRTRATSRASRRPRRRTLVVASVVGALVVGAGALGVFLWQSGPLGKVTVAGSVKINGYYIEGSGDSTLVIESDGTCEIFGGDDDVNAGASVTVYDAAGAIIGNGRLQQGEKFYRTPLGEGYVGACSFGFSLDVPPSDFFQVEIERRGKVTVAREDAGTIMLLLE